MIIPGVPDLQSGYDDLDVSVAIIAGDGDKILFKRRAERLHHRLKGSTFGIVKGAGHMVHYFVEPAEIFPGPHAAGSHSEGGQNFISANS